MNKKFYPIGLINSFNRWFIINDQNKNLIQRISFDEKTYLENFVIFENTIFSIIANILF